MPSILIKEIPTVLHRQLKERAKRNRRSMNQEVLLILEQTVRELPPVVLPEPIKALRRITAEMISAAIREGRR